MTNGMRELKYLVESHEPWTPDKLVIPPWETGLIPSYTVDYLVEITTIDIASAIEL